MLIKILTANLFKELKHYARLSLCVLSHLTLMAPCKVGEVFVYLSQRKENKVYRDAKYQKPPFLRLEDLDRVITP